MRLEDSILVTISCIDVSSDSFMACNEPYIGGWILGDDAHLTAIEINQKMHSTPNKVGSPITQSAWLVDSVWGIDICGDDVMLDVKLQQAFDLPSAYNILNISPYAEMVRQRCEPLLKSSYDTRSGLFAIKRGLDDKRLITPEGDTDFFDEIRERSAVVKSVRDATIEAVLTELDVGFTVLL